MPEESRTRRLAILIDADNTSPRIAAGLFEEVAKFGEASVRRIYGDFSGQRSKNTRSTPTSSLPTRLERTRPTSPW